MTRINCVPVTQLLDEHLMAEYRELPMVPQALRRTLKSKTGFKPNNVSPKYKLNGGHVYFFYNKLSYLQKRYEELITELKRRNYNLDPNRDAKLKGLPKKFYNDWTPDKLDQEVNNERLRLRVWEKPEIYHFKGKKFLDAREDTRELWIYDQKKTRMTV